MTKDKRKGPSTVKTKGTGKPTQNTTISSTSKSAAQRPAPEEATQNTTTLSTSDSATQRPPLGEATAAVNNTESIDELRAQLQKLQEENGLLKQEKLENQKGRDTTKQRTQIPRPSGGVSAWKLQEAMQLTGSVEKSKMYAGIQRVVVEAVRASPINWSSPWSKIPPNLKADLYATVRSKVEGIDRYEQDWATEGLARQYLKNRRSYGYRNGQLDVPEKYQYLKNNAAQRSEAPRGNAHKRKAAQAKREEITAKRARTSKGKEKAVDEEEEDEDDEEDEEAGDG